MHRRMTAWGGVLAALALGHAGAAPARAGGPDADVRTVSYFVAGDPLTGL
jgi:hypothetical protein